MKTQTTTRTVAALAMLTVAALGGCASGGMGAAGGAESVTVHVENNLIPPTSLSVYAVSDTGSRQLVGIVSPSSTRTLSFDPIAVSGQYVLVADGNGADLTSNPMTLGPGDTVEWDLSANLAVVLNPGR